MSRSKRDRKKKRERTRGRQKRSQEDRDVRKTRRLYLDLTKTTIADVEWFKSGKRNLINVVPFEVTNPEYQNLRSPAGKKIGMKPGDEDYKLELPIHRNMGRYQI